MITSSCVLTSTGTGDLRTWACKQPCRHPARTTVQTRCALSRPCAATTTRICALTRTDRWSGSSSCWGITTTTPSCLTVVHNTARSASIIVILKNTVFRLKYTALLILEGPPQGVHVLCLVGPGARGRRPGRHPGGVRAALPVGAPQGAAVHERA